HLIVCVLSLSATLSAQSFYIPTNTPTVGTANAFPFNTTNMRYQALIRATELGSTPVLIRGFSLAPSTSGTLEYGPVTMKMAHLASPTLSTTFDTNLAAGAVTTMDVPAFVWPVTANTWMDIDLQTPFVYNGVDNVVVEFLVTNRVTGAAMRRDATNQRVYLGSYTGQLTGTDGGLTAFKMRVITGDASTATFGRGCPGSTQLTPTVSFTGTSQIGQNLGHNVNNLLPTALCIAAFGFTSAPPFPIDLTFIGLTGCKAYIDFVVTFATIADPAGTATVGIAIPADPALVGFLLYSQWIALDGGAAGGLTTSNYGRALVGN
ncbi:MAG TPA: hypothetical protein VFO67_06900, partial [Gemmatimonadales bacterium]|nr:hypothetical protein [Gemmatimonadales bacterium]